MAKKVSEEHPFLYHYTDWDSLRGMLDTNEIWATHVRNLNDESEYLLAQNFIESRLRPHIKTWLEVEVTQNTDLSALVQNLGGIEHQTADLSKSAMQAMYQVTGNDFFVSSFCGTPSNEYEKQNGLLSQWRGYGAKQGILLVFETAAVEEMMSLESKQCSYDMMYLADVVYDNCEDTIKRELSEDFIRLQDFVISMTNSIINRSQPPQGSDAMISFIKIATRLKHHAFSEEKEVRLVAAVIEQTPKFLEFAKAQNIVPAAQKPIGLRNGYPAPRPFIKLFGRNFPSLPIQKIIIGPGRDKITFAQSLQKGLRGRKIEISVSDIPYV